jgi:serine/threonine-protein kinase HipA
LYTLLNDDHLRNHGFLLTKNGWILSPAYDINANEYGQGLSLNISLDDNSLDTGLALEVAGYFRLGNTKANKIIGDIKNAVSRWKTVAVKYKISKSEQDRMETAFFQVSTRDGS